MMCLLFIGLYYLVGMLMSAYMVKARYIVLDGGQGRNGRVVSDKAMVDEQGFAYAVVPLCWPFIVMGKIVITVFKLHVIIHTILTHATNVFNIRITKEDGNTVIRFHVPKKSEL